MKHDMVGKKIWMKPFNCLLNERYVCTDSANVSLIYECQAIPNEPHIISSLQLYQNGQAFKIDKNFWNFDTLCIDLNRKYKG